MRFLFELKKLCFCALFLMCAGCWSFVCAVPQTNALQIIPEPKRVEATDDNFRLKSGMRVSVADSKSAGDRFAAQDFIADVRQTANVELKIGGGSILIGLLGNARIRNEFERAKLDVPADLNAEGYALIVTPNRIIVGGATEA